MAKTTTTKKTVAKKATPKATAKKKAAPKQTVATAKSDGKETVRVRALRALLAKPMTAPEVKAAIALSHGLKPTLDQEVERGHLRYAAPNEENGVTVYQITAKGKTALKNGTVDPPRGAAK